MHAWWYLTERRIAYLLTATGSVHACFELRLWCLDSTSRKLSDQRSIGATCLDPREMRPWLVVYLSWH